MAVVHDIFSRVLEMVRGWVQKPKGVKARMQHLLDASSVKLDLDTLDGDMTRARDDLTAVLSMAIFEGQQVMMLAYSFLVLCLEL